VVFDVGETVILAPVLISVPPQLPVYHLEDASPPTAVNVVVVPEQILVFPVIAVGANAVFILNGDK
jgi:hypothetical protein